MDNTIQRLNLGCGFKKMENAINIDISDKSCADKIIDLEKGKLPYKDNSVKEIYAFHVFEHIKNFIPLMNEIYRILKKEGILFIKVPQGKGMFADPTHVRFFNDLSFRYFCGYPFSEIYGINTLFKQEEIVILPNQDGGELLVKLRK